MPGEYELSDLGGVLGQDLYNNLFSTQGFEGFGDGYGEQNNRWYGPEVMGAGDIGWLQGERIGGFAGNWSGTAGTNEGGSAMFSGIPTEDAMNAFNGYKFNWTPTGGQGGILEAFDPSGKFYGKFEQQDEDTFTKLMGMVAPVVASMGFGGALSGMFGGGMTGGALGHGLASGSMSSMQGGDFGKGFLSGAVSGGLQGLAQGTPAVMGNNPSAYVPATPGTSIAGSMGVTSPLAAGMINRGSGSFLGALAGGSSGKEALQSGLTGAALSGINSVGKTIMAPYMESLKGWLGTGSTPDTSTQANYSMGDTSYGSNYMAPGQEVLRAAGLFPEMSNVPPSSTNFQTLDTIGLPDYDVNPYANASYPEGGYKPNGVSALEQAGIRNEMSYAPPGTEGDIGGDFLNDILSPGNVPQQSVQSVGAESSPLASLFGNAGSRLGNFALNNAGDLASMLYGFYNNRRQQKALGQQAASLQGLYGQNSPYATQLRAKLNAQAAAGGRRSNVAGRETQLQAMLADRASSMAPTLMQINQARGQLKNSLGSNTLSMLNKMGAFQGLANMFRPSNPMGNYSMANNTNDYNLLGGLEGMR